MAPKQPPTSPTQLLWAHQLKREHGFLLDRMQKLESAIDRVEKSVTATDKSNDIAAIAKQVKSLNDNAGTTKAMIKIRDEIMVKLGGLHGDIESLVSKVAAIEKEGGQFRSDSKKAHEREVAMMKRLKDVEDEMKRHKDSLALLEREDGDEERLKQIREKLKDLAKMVVEDHEGLEKVEGMIKALERVQELMSQGNDDLEAQVRELREREQAREREGEGERGGSAVFALGDEAEASDEELPEPQPSKPISMKIAAAPSARTTAKATAPTKAAPRAGPKKAPAKPAPGSAPAKSQLKPPAAGLLKVIKKEPAKKVLANSASLNRSGKHRVEALRSEDSDDVGDEMVVSPRKENPAKRGVAKYLPPQPNLMTDTDLDKPIVRAGKGWVTVARTPSLEETEEDEIVVSPPTVSRKRGSDGQRGKVHHGISDLDATEQPPIKKPRLARQISTQRSVEDPLSPAPKHRTIRQNNNTKARQVLGGGRGKARRADPVMDDSIDVDAPRLTRNQRNKPAEVMMVKKEPMKFSPKKKNVRRGLTNVFSSPVSEPPSEVQETQQPDVKSPPNKRRTIQQGRPRKLPQTHGRK